MPKWQEHAHKIIENETRKPKHLGYVSLFVSLSTATSNLTQESGNCNRD